MGARELQFGIFRAMGLSKRQLISMLVLELVIISGSAIAAGIVIGSMVSAVFIPFFQITYSAFEQVPPFVIITNIMDHIKLLIVIAIMFAIGVAILVRLVFKLIFHRRLNSVKINILFKDVFLYSIDYIGKEESVFGEFKSR